MSVESSQNCKKSKSRKETENRKALIAYNSARTFCFSRSASASLWAYQVIVSDSCLDANVRFFAFLETGGTLLLALICSSSLLLRLQTVLLPLIAS